MDDRELSERWNSLGRSFRKAYSQRIAEFYAGEREEVKYEKDPRGEELAEQVLERVRTLNREGDWERARQLFDPAWEPFFHRLSANRQNLEFATILGADRFLLRLGWADERAELVQFDGDDISTVEDVIGCAVSGNRRFFALACGRRGLVVRDGFDGPLVAESPWPEPEARVPNGLSPELRNRWQRGTDIPHLSDMRVSNDGRRVVIVSFDEGVLLADFRQNPAAWRLLYPDYTWCGGLDVLEELIEEGKDEASEMLDMVHADLSPDGTLAALGKQLSAHYLVALDGGEKPPFARIGQQFEYPHYARFSGDGRYVTLNSCHSYDGMTGVLEVPSTAGLEIPEYEADSRFPTIDSAMRVYAAAWLPPKAAGKDTGAFVLAGAGWMKCVTPKGEVLWDHFFGSTASSLDYCPKTNTLLLGSFSGFLHVLDPSSEAEAGIEIGFRPRKELKRWVLWREEAAPLQW